MSNTIIILNLYVILLLNLSAVTVFHTKFIHIKLVIFMILIKPKTPNDSISYLCFLHFVLKKSDKLHLSDDRALLK